MELHVPYDERLEQEVIGAMLYDPACIVEVIGLIQPTSFHTPKYQALYQEIFRLWQEDERRVNPIELLPFLTKTGIPITEINTLIAQIISTATIPYHAQRLRDIAALRSIVHLGREMVSWGLLKDREDIREAINQANQRIHQITDQAMSVDTMNSLPGLLQKFASHLEELIQQGTAITGIPTGFECLDYLTTGFKKQDLIILAARPSMGKTAFAIEITLQMALRQKSVAFFELEMSDLSVAQRMIANSAGIDSVKLSSGMVTPAEYLQYTQALSHLLQSCPSITVDTSPGITVAEIKAKSRKIKREKGLDCIIVDYLGLIGGYTNMSRYDKVSENTRQLKNMARELDCPVITLCQLSRAVEQRQDKRPMLSDLRETGEVEQTADLVMFLYRDDYYTLDTTKKNICEIILGKHRNGPLGKVELLFLKKYNKFLPLDRKGAEKQHESLVCV
jgi:replicative DNA helicase